MTILLALAVALALAHQESAPASSVEASSTPEARARWERVCAASGDAQREPLRSFQLQADVITRAGVQTNEAHIDYRYLAPDCIRFVLPSKNETGRFGPAPEQYWLKSGEELVELAGREYKEDRRAVDDMLALARNYVALSNPARLKLLRLEIPPAPPADLGPELEKRTRKLTWLTLESPDFALVRGEPARGESAPEAPAVYRVELGLREDFLPAVAIVRARGKPAAEPLLVEFSRYEEQGGFKIPFVLLVYVLDRTKSPAAFASQPAQAVYVTTAVLRAPLTVADFQPKTKKDKQE